jgi:hypothetical protein
MEWPCTHRGSNFVVSGAGNCGDSIRKLFLISAAYAVPYPNSAAGYIPLRRPPCLRWKRMGRGCSSTYSRAK